MIICEHDGNFKEAKILNVCQLASLKLTCEPGDLVLHDGLCLAGRVPLHIVLQQLLGRAKQNNQSETVSVLCGPIGNRLVGQAHFYIVLQQLLGRAKQNNQ
jgi:ubiquinone biosynthesis protein UbiJ